MAHPAWNEIPLGDDLILFRDGSRDIHILDAASAWVWEARKSGLGAADIQHLLEVRRTGVPLTAAQVDRWFELWRKTESTSQANPPDGPATLEGRTVSLDPPLADTSSCYQFCDLAVRIGWGDHGLHRRGHEVLRHLAVREAVTTREVTVSLYRSGGCIVVQTDARKETFNRFDDALSFLVFIVVESVLSARPRLITLHAGAVAHQELGVILMGCGGSGKSTLVAALNAGGFAYMGDDVVPIDKATRQIVPVPVAICLKQKSWEAVEAAAQASPYQRRGQAVKYVAPSNPRIEPVDSYIVVCPVYDPGRSVATVQTMTPKELFIELVRSESILARHMTRAYVEQIAKWVGTLAAYRICYGNTGDALKSISQVLSHARSTGGA